LQVTRRSALFAGGATIEALLALPKRSQRYSLRFGSALGMIFKALRHEKNDFCGQPRLHSLHQLFIAMIRDFCDDVIAHVHIAMTMKIRLIVQP